MVKKMKRIIVTDKCVACGYCVLGSEFMEENSDGTAKVKEPGLITSEQYIEFQDVERECPANAIIVTDDSISSINEIDAIIELKSMINEKIKNYEIERPSEDEYGFSEEDYKAPSMITNGISNTSYSSYSKAKSEGYYKFNDSLFSQRLALAQSVCIEYRTKKLKKYAYNEKEKGNFYYDNNEKISNLLKEAVILGQSICEDRMNIPKDFCEFEVGPDNGFDGEEYCWKLRNLEQILGLTDHMTNAEYFEIYINVEDYGEDYKYSLCEVEEKFREDIVRGLEKILPSIIKYEINNIYKKYSEVFQNLLNDKLILLKSELKRCVNIEESSLENRENLLNDISKLMTEFRKANLKKEVIYKNIDQSYDSSYRFSSYDKCYDSVYARKDRYYNECCNYLSTDYSNRISSDLAEKYKNQFQNIINEFVNKLQIIYDKYGVEYPNENLIIRGGKQTIDVSISNFEDITSYINWDIRDFIDEKVIGCCGVLNKHDYLNYTEIDYEIFDKTTYKQGWFGEKQVKIYSYMIKFGNMEMKFREAEEFCCDYVYSSDYMREYFENIKNSLIKEINDKIIDEK